MRTTPSDQATDRRAIAALAFAYRGIRAARVPAPGCAGCSDRCGDDRQGRASRQRRLACAAVFPCREIIPAPVSGKGLNRPVCSLVVIAIITPGMVGLTDTQLKTIMTVAQTVSVERRSVFLERVGAMLRMRGYGHFTDSDVSDVTALALCGLIHIDAA